MDNYQIGMQWDSYEGSPFVETNTTWVDAYDEYEAKEKARSEFGHHKGFQINYADKQ